MSLFLGPFLKECRMNKGLTQREVGLKLKYSCGQFVHNNEAGKSMPPLKDVPKLARLYGVDPNEIYSRMYSHEVRILSEKYHELMSNV